MERLALFTLLALNAYSAIPEVFSPERKIEIFESFSEGLFKSKLQHFGEHKGFGIIATDYIKVGEPIAREIKYNKHVTFETFEWYPYFSDVEEIVLVVGRLVYERLVNTKNADSNFFAHLPPSQVETVHNWTESEKDYLDSCFQIKLRITSPIDYEKGKNIYLKTVEQIPEIKNICPQCLTEEAWMWGFMTALSRRFSITKANWKFINNYAFSDFEKNIEGSAFLPLLELFNHMPRPFRSRKVDTHMGVVFSPPGHATLFSDREFQPGEEVFWRYNDYDNFKLFLNYGFILEENIDDRMTVYVNGNHPCPGNKITYRVEGKCTFEPPVYQLDQYLLKYLILNYGNANVKGNIDLEVLYEQYPDLRPATLKSLNGYRSVISRNSVSRCLKSYRLISRKLKSFNYESESYRTVDKLCKATYWTFFEHLKLVDRNILKFYLKDLSLSN